MERKCRPDYYKYFQESKSIQIKYSKLGLNSLDLPIWPVYYSSYIVEFMEDYPPTPTTFTITTQNTGIVNVSVTAVYG